MTDEKVVYLQDIDALAFYKAKATPDFWDHHWQIEDLRNSIISCTNDSTFIPSVKHHLPVGSTILEGGCGRGQLVHALQYQGYRAIGVDFADSTVHRINAEVPELDVQIGDVRVLELDDGELDGYVSAGVIEHFWEGYDLIIKEMARTLRVGGFLFITFPYMSPLRRLKVKMGMYPCHTVNDAKSKCETFYQFALPAKQVQHDLERYGFCLVERRSLGGIKGFKDEVSCVKPWLQDVYDGKRGNRITRYLLDAFLGLFAGHIVLLVMQKVDQPVKRSAIREMWHIQRW